MEASTRKKIILLFVVVVIIMLLRNYAPAYFSLEAIKGDRETFQAYVDQHYLIAAIIYLATYFVTTAFAVPVAAPLTLAGGFLFGTVIGGTLTIIGATLGALVLFLMVRFLIGSAIQQRYAKRLAWLNNQIAQHGDSYLLSLRFLALVPFFMINLVAGLTPVSLWTYGWTTAIGIAPGSMVFAFAGQQLGNISSARDVFTPPVMIAFALLALLALIPTIIKKMRGNKNQGQSIK